MIRTVFLSAVWAVPVFAQSSVVDVVKQAAPSVVSVQVLFDKTNSGGRISTSGLDAVQIERPGSGIFVSEAGLILTNAHLVAEIREDSDEYWVVVGPMHGPHQTATVIARDEQADLALLRIDNPAGVRYPALRLGTAHDEPVGARIVALSSPAGGKHYAFAGTLAFASGPIQLRDATLEPWQVILSDARFHDLLDGGPLLNAQGHVLGIHNSSHLSERPEGFGESEDDEEEEVDTDYAVIVSSEAIEKSMGALIEQAARAASSEPDVASAAIAAVSSSVVSVSYTPEGVEQTPADPADPQHQRIPESLGSGVVVDASGLVLTSSDFFKEEGGAASIRTQGGVEYSAQLLGINKGKRLALLKVDLPEGMVLPAATLGDSSEAVSGEFTAVVARPFPAAVTTSVGVVSALDREGFLQIASWIHPGHWGGAVVDRDGRLIGIAVRQIQSTKDADKDSFLGFAAPIAGLTESFADLWTEHGATNVVVAASAEELSMRQTAVTRVVEKTRSSLINVMVSRAIPKKATGFDPFATSDTVEYLPLGQGSGVIIEESGLAISNWHVVDGALADDGTQDPDYKIEVTLPDGRKFEAHVLSTSRDDDLSLLALEIDPGDVLVPVPLGNSTRLRPGQPVVAIGNPLGLANSASAGIISTTRHDVKIRGRLREYKNMVMTDAAINPGNSGGALLDMEGRLVGINSAGRVGLGMAIPVNTARKVFSDKLLSAKSLRSVYLGIAVKEENGGLVIGSMDWNGPAKRAGAEVGDRIQLIGAHAPDTPAAFARVLLELDSNRPCALRVERDGEVKDLELQPVAYVAWEIQRSCGIEVLEVDYASETELVRDASVALHRSYTQSTDSQPSDLMRGALRVVRVGSIKDVDSPLIEVGDLLLGVTAYKRGTAAVHERLERFESLADLSEAFKPLATKQGTSCQCWVLRAGEVITVTVFVRRPPR